MSAAEDFEAVRADLRVAGTCPPSCLQHRGDRHSEDCSLAALERIRAAFARSVERLRASYREGECYGRDGPEDYDRDCSTLRPGDPCITCLAKEVMETLS